MLQPLGQRGLLGRREEAQRDLPDGRARAAARDSRRDRLGPRHRRAEDRLERRQRAAQPRPRDRRRHALSAAARTTSCRTSCTCSPTAASCGRAARSWRSSSKTRATAGSRPSRRERRRSHGAGRRTARDATRRLRRVPARRRVRRRARSRRAREAAFAAFLAQRVSDDARRGVAVHERRADRGDAVRAGRRRDARSRRGSSRSCSRTVMPHRIVARERPRVGGAVDARQLPAGRDAFAALDAPRHAACLAARAGADAVRRSEHRVLRGRRRRSRSRRRPS